MASVHRIGLIVACMCAFFLIGITPVMADVYGRISSYFRIRCSLFTDESSCISASCYWWDGFCSPFPAVVEKETIIEIEAGIMMGILLTATVAVFLMFGML